ncbi:MAG TPA: polysaccharide deacetylase [Gammaproteobacteria bacterium]|nr:polysaccharide deacetylase [Gammaproteobacteria bacterium]
MKNSIIMYHYVRELQYSRFPHIKGLETDQFKEQITYIKKHYNVISGDDLLAAVEAGSLETLPPSALLLTFDDGYIDHFTQVFPILRREKLSGCFFPPAQCVLDNQVLDVNKIHFILASVPGKQEIVDYIFQILDEYRAQYEIQSNSYYWEKLAVPNRFDPKEVIFIKRILQRDLPEQLRRIIINSLFHKYVSCDEVSFAKELYMSMEQLMCMRDSGMYVGSHGYGHYWLDSIDPPMQKREVELALEFLRQVGTRTNSWIMCYPYGAYNDSLLSILAGAGCKIGLTTEVGIADFQRDNLLTLPRLDTNDLPKSANAEQSKWTRQAKETSLEH